MFHIKDTLKKIRSNYCFRSNYGYGTHIFISFLAILVVIDLTFSIISVVSTIFEKQISFMGVLIYALLFSYMLCYSVLFLIEYSCEEFVSEEKKERLRRLRGATYSRKDETEEAFLKMCKDIKKISQK